MKLLSLNHKLYQRDLQVASAASAKEASTVSVGAQGPQVKEPENMATQTQRLSEASCFSNCSTTSYDLNLDKITEMMIFMMVHTWVGQRNILEEALDPVCVIRHQSEEKDEELTMSKNKGKFV